MHIHGELSEGNSTKMLQLCHWDRVIPFGLLLHFCQRFFCSGPTCNISRSVFGGRSGRRAAVRRDMSHVGAAAPKSPQAGDKAGRRLIDLGKDPFFLFFSTTAMHQRFEVIMNREEFQDRDRGQILPRIGRPGPIQLLFVMRFVIILLKSMTRKASTAREAERPKEKLSIFYLRTRTRSSHAPPVRFVRGIITSRDK